MRSTAHLQGHPIHPMLVGFPIAYLLGSVGMDALAKATGDDRFFRTAKDLGTIGLASALVAAVPGIIDYLFTVPPNSSAKTRATDHLLANVSALTLFAAAHAGRRADDARPRWWGLAAEAAAAGLMGFAGWLGGALVHRNQIGVDHRYANAGKWRTETVARSGDGRALVPGKVADDLRVDQMRLLVDGKRRTVLARTERGLAAFNDRCTHRGGPLSDGTLACGTVQCPWHGSQFDVHTGEVLQGPAEEAIEAFDARLTDDGVAIEPRRARLS